MSKSKARLVVILFTLALFMAGDRAGAVETSVLFVNPPSQTSDLAGGPFEVSLMIDDVSNEQGIGGYTFIMAYDPTVVHGLPIEDSGYLASTGNGVICPSSGIDNDTGRLALYCFTLAILIEPLPGPQTSEPQELARVTFEPVGAGTTALDISETTITDPQGNTLAASRTNGEVTIAAPAPAAIPTGTPTPTSTATSTLTSTATSTPSATPSQTLTPVTEVLPTAKRPSAALGDVNCDNDVNSIDAALLLQLDARLIETLACKLVADVDGDGSVNTIDATLILQFYAGLIGTFPPP